jgi:hypothetical protein
MRAISLCVLGCVGMTFAATPPKSTPPVAQVWIDLATYSGSMMPAGMGSVAGLLGGVFGASKGANSFGNTQGMSAGRWMDVTLSTRKNPSLQEGVQKVPQGSQLAPQLNLLSPQEGKPVPMTESEEESPAPEFKRPKGKVLLYWGCGSEVRKGQPRVLDMATADMADFAKVFQSRRATTRGTHSSPGRPIWPNKSDSRMIPDGASLQGEHEFSGDGVPEGFKFNLDAQHDLMPAIDLKQRDEGQAVVFNWQAMPQARAWFMASMSMKNQDEMVFWSSSELPDAGFGLLDYQPNAAIDRWLKEKVLLPAQSIECKAPKEALGQGMLRLIAYGDELNLAYPPRPKDPKVVWNPQWAAKVRLKSMATSMVGMSVMERGSDKPAQEKPKSPDAVDLLKGIFGM